jgi:hypothetical protein
MLVRRIANLYEVINVMGYRIQLMARSPQDALKIASETPLSKWQEPRQ